MRCNCHQAIGVGLLLGLAMISRDHGLLPRAMADAAPQSKAQLPGDPSDRDAFAGYRDWKGVTKEPIGVPALGLALCAPAATASQRGPHQDGYIAVFVSPNAREAYLAPGRPRFVEGAVIVKEKLKGKTDEHPQELGVMIKRAKGFDEKTGDWQFMFVDKDDNLVSERSEVQSCRTCHQLKKEQDYVFRKLAATLNLSKAGKVKQ